MAEICDATIALLKNPNTNIDKILDIIKAPDFTGGAYIIYDREQMRKIYETGVGSFKMRSKYVYDKKENINIKQLWLNSLAPVIFKLVKENLLISSVTWNNPPLPLISSITSP